jgi:alpha-tubulin suppressor-like RCC1 family protein
MEADSMNDFQNNINLLRFPGEHSVRISFVACGGEHLFAISRMNELFGWGRNDEG